MDEEVAKFVQDAKKGDVDAFGRIYNLFLERIYRFIYYLLYDAETSEDLTQDTFLKAWKAITRYDEKKASFITFIYTIARNLVIDHQRKRREVKINESSEHNLGYEENFEEKIGKGEESEKVREVLGTLEEFDRQLIIFRYFEDLSFSDIAKIVGKEEGTVRVRVFRVLKILKERLEI